MSNVTEIHEHQWCYHGDLLLEEVSTHRQEWCVDCGTVRVKFELGWAYQYPDHFRKRLEAGEVVERDKYVGKVPERAFKEKGGRSHRRLGRGLKDIVAQTPIPNYRGLFPAPKKET